MIGYSSSLAAGVALFALTSTAYAEQPLPALKKPMQLSEKQLDTVTAGLNTADINCPVCTLASASSMINNKAVPPKPAPPPVAKAPPPARFTPRMPFRDRQGSCLRRPRQHRFHDFLDFRRTGAFPPTTPKLALQ